MLVLNRKEGEKIFVGDAVTITLISTRSDGTAKIGIDAPASTAIYRDDVAPEGFKPYGSPPITRRPKQRRRYAIHSGGNGAFFTLVRLSDGATRFLQDGDAVELGKALETTNAKFTDDDVADLYFE